MKIHYFQQRTPEWDAERRGKLTGTGAPGATMDPSKAGYRNLLAQLALERITGKTLGSSFQSSAMLQGIEREADAILMYEAITGVFVTKTGFIAHDDLMAGCSLDGHVGGERIVGIVEAKSPIEATHCDYLLTGKIPGDYYKQVIHNLWITGAQWCDWLSYNPSFPTHLQVKLIRIERNEAEIAAYEKSAKAFLQAVEARIQALNTLTDLRGTLAKAAVA